MRNQFMKQAWIIFGPLKWRLFLVVAVIVFGQALAMVGTYIQGVIIDGIGRGIPMNRIHWYIALAGLTMLVSLWIAQAAREWYEIDKVDFDIEANAGDHTMNRMADLSVGQHNNLHSQLKKSIVDRGQHSLTALVFMAVYDIFPTVSQAFLMMGAVWWMDAKAGLVVASVTGLFTVLTFWQNRYYRPRMKKLEKMWNRESKFRGEIFQNIGHVLVNAQEKKARSEADSKYLETVAVAKPLWKRFTLYAHLRATMLTVGIIAVLDMGAVYVHNGSHTLGEVVMIWAWSGIALNNLRRIGSQHRQIMRMWVSIVRFCEFLALENDVKVVPNPVVLEPLRGRIEVRNLSFVYGNRMAFSFEDDEENPPAEEDDESKEKRAALHGVSFVIEPGETVAIVGESGSAKTTLANLLVRSSDPTGGQILIDGQDLRVVDIHDYRQKVGYVEQHVPLFDRSVRDNILYGLNGKAKDVTTEELERIAQVAQISRFSHKLEKGFDTLIGERGIKLSGGERQRIGIARALIKNPSILIFDEATSSLDAAIEAEIREAIKEASRGRTTIIIAHRFSTIRYANRIIVMDKGRIAGEGKHDELYKTCEPYRRLVESQMAQFT